MWDRVVREQAQQREQAWASAQKPKLTPEQRAMVRAAVDSSVQRLYPGPAPRSQYVPPVSSLTRHANQARWAHFIQRVEQDEEMRRVHRSNALEERAKQLRPQSVQVRLKQAHCSSMRQERMLFAQAVSPRPPATPRSSERRRVCRGSEVAKQLTVQSATRRHATPRSQSARHGSSRTSRNSHTAENHGNPRAQSAMHWLSRTSRDTFAPKHIPVRPILPPAPCIESGEALAAEIFAKVERHIKQCATPGKHTYLITPRREVAMTRQLVAEVDILATLPEAARFKIASRMKTLYRVQPGQVIIQKGVAGNEMCVPTACTQPALFQLAKFLSHRRVTRCRWSQVLCHQRHSRSLDRRPRWQASGAAPKGFVLWRNGSVEGGGAERIRACCYRDGSVRVGET